MDILAWCVMGLLAGGLARRAVGSPKRGCLVTMVIGILGALLAGALSKVATGQELDTFDELDLGSIFVAFIGASALLLVLEAASGRKR
jgi:uncharacterized membrane protein YeaQ/YmgE (transglycosylase-associated protein family)